MEGNRVHELRVRLGLSQERFARLLGVSLQTVRRWESGLSRPLPIIGLKLQELSREAGLARSRTGGAPVAERRSTVRVETGLGGLFKGLGSLLDLVAQLSQEGKREASRTGEVEALGGKLKGVYGLTVRLGLEGEPVIEQFGNIQETETGPVVAETRDPLADVLDEGSGLVVVAELPGVEEKDIHIRVEGDMLEITAATRDRKYFKELLLPAQVDPASLETSYRNGILEVRLTKL